MRAIIGMAIVAALLMHAVDSAGQDAGTDGGAGIEAILDEAMKKIAVARSKEAHRMFKKRDYPGALSRYREAHELDPQSPEIANSLGYIYYLLGNPEEAERLYRWAMALDPERFIAYLNLADLLSEYYPEPERLKEAEGLLVSARELKGNKPKVIIRQARIAAMVGNFPEAERFYQEYLHQRKPTDKLRLELGDFYRDLGRTEESLRWYREIDDEELGKKAAGRMWEIEVEKQTREFGWTNPTGVIPAGARALASRGRMFLQKGLHAEAERLLGEALEIAPGFSMARADMGDLYYREGRYQEAELAYLRALAVDQRNAEIYARLGDLYLSATVEEPRSAQAAMFLARALDLRPDWTELHFRLAMALRGAGDLVGALRHVTRYLNSGQDIENRQTALSLKRSMEALVPPEAMAEAGVLNEALALRDDMSEELILAMGTARAHLARGETDSAMAVLRSLGDEDRGLDILSLEARILIGAGKMDESVGTLERSLEIDESQGFIHSQLGTILIGLGDEALGRIHLLRAEELKELEATYHIARLDVGEEEAGITSWTRDLARIPRLLESRDRLDRFLKKGAVSIYRKDAGVLRKNIDDRLTALIVAAGSLLFLVVLGVTLAAIRLWGGVDLRTLIEEHPETGPEVQRILSAVRHEVLKHNAMMLGGLVDAMERGQEATNKARHFATSIVGREEGDGVAVRLQGYVDDLKKIGDANRRRLNLLRKDAAIAPLLRGTKLLEKVAADLSSFDSISERRRIWVLRTLQTASRLLNTEGYEAVRELLDRLRILVVNEDLLRAVFDRCVGEPSFSGVAFAPLDLEMDVDFPFGTPVPRTALEDILANLMRNAIQSSIQHGGEDREILIGLGVRSEVDTITGLERVVFLVRDRSGEGLTAEMLRGRYIEEGLGLTADLVSRYDGTLDVAAGEGGWSKSVVVKLPLNEVSVSGREETRRTKK